MKNYLILKNKDNFIPLVILMITHKKHKKKMIINNDNHQIIKSGKNFAAYLEKYFLASQPAIMMIIPPAAMSVYIRGDELFFEGGIVQAEDPVAAPRTRPAESSDVVAKIKSA